MKYDCIDAGGKWHVVYRSSGIIIATFDNLPEAISFRDAANTGRVVNL